MKKLLFILSLVFVTSSRLFAQDTDENEGGEKIRDKMSEYIQQRLDLSKDETEKFTPIFIRYFKEWRQTLRQNKDLPRLDLQQKILDLRLKYRNLFKDVIGEKRSNEVFGHQEAFIRTLKNLRQERLGNNPRAPLRRNRVNKLL
jgi:hypothetical protein